MLQRKQSLHWYSYTLTPAVGGCVHMYVFILHVSVAQGEGLSCMPSCRAGCAVWMCVGGLLQINGALIMIKASRRPDQPQETSSSRQRDAHVTHRPLHSS